MADRTPVLAATRRACAVLLAAGASALGAKTQAAEAGRDSPAVAAVRAFLLSLEQHDTSLIMSFFAPDAQVFRLRKGEWGVSKLVDVVKSMSSGYGNLAKAAGVSRFSEPIEDVGEKSFDSIATVWTRYQVFNDGKLHHSGNTVFSLMRQDGRWLITNITDEATRIYA